MGAKTIISHRDGLAFDVQVNGHKMILDADERYGGRDLGPRPKPLLLCALGGCTGMDVVSIVNKMRVENFSLEIEIEGIDSDEEPVIYKEIKVVFKFTGENLPHDKLRRAVELSQTKYCGVAAMLRKAAELSYRITVNGEEI